MAHKAETHTQLSTTEQDQVQDLFSQYHHLTDALHQSTEPAQAEQALSVLNTRAEHVQIALLKLLAREDSSDAADLLAAINVFSPHKEVRKEARRALIRLEASKTYPQWTPPALAAPAAVQLQVDNPPRFWKGFVSQTREEGEIQLILCWEQGYNYSEARGIFLLLDYWQAGAKDLMVELGTKRRVDALISDFRTAMPEKTLVNVTLAEGRRLLQEALAVNARHQIQPGVDFRNQRPLIDRLILQATEVGEDSGRTFITPEMEDQEVVVNFLGGWSLDDYGLAYDLLSQDSPLREDLTRDQWIEQHATWANEAHPTRLELGFVRERPATTSAIWLPNMNLNTPPSRKEIEVGWSLELIDTELSGTLQEMPMASSINKETGRHWFWTSYVVVRENNTWRIHKATDEVLKLQGLAPQEIRDRIKTDEEAIDKLLQQQSEQTQAFMEELSWRLTELMHLYDTLTRLLPLDRQVADEAYARSVMIGNPEHMLVTLERLQRFPEGRGDILRRLGSTYAGLAYNEKVVNRAELRAHLLSRAEELLREAITLDDSANSRVLLAELLESLQRNDEAEAEFLQARERNPNAEEEASLEAGLGNLAMGHERIDEALPHFKRVSELDPKFPGIWFNLGFAQRLLWTFRGS